MIRGGMITLPARDVGAAVRFYVETLGMKLVEERADGAAVIDAGDGLRIALRAGAPAAGGGGAVVTLAPKLPIREAIAILENRGVTLRVSDDAGAVVASFEDPDGNALALREDALAT